MNSRSAAKNEKKAYNSARNYVALGRYLQEMRLKAKLTQREVSSALDYSSAQFISNFESGMSSPPLKKLQIMIDMYRMPVDRVMALILEGEREILATILRPSSAARVRDLKKQA